MHVYFPSIPAIRFIDGLPTYSYYSYEQPTIAKKTIVWLECLIYMTVYHAKLSADCCCLIVHKSFMGV